MDKKIFIISAFFFFAIGVIRISLLDHEVGEYLVSILFIIASLVLSITGYIENNKNTTP